MVINATRAALIQAIIGARIYANERKIVNKAGKVIQPLDSAQIAKLSRSIYNMSPSAFNKYKKSLCKNIVVRMKLEGKI